MGQNFSKIALVLVGVLSAQSIVALPTLQLDVVGGTYVAGTDEDTTISAGPIFDLEALVQASYLNADPNRVYFLAAAIIPKTSVPLETDFGSFTINGVTYDATHGMVWGRPPVDGEQHPGELAPHGIYDTHYAEVAFTFSGSDLIGAYNAETGETVPGLLNRQTFDVDVTGLAAGYQVHFDLYNTEFIRKKKLNLEVINDFAPFSHDAQSGPGIRVPDAGSTLVLLGMALAVFGGAHRLLRSEGKFSV